jgi:hypothetical protein
MARFTSQSQCAYHELLNELQSTRPNAFWNAASSLAPTHSA